MIWNTSAYRAFHTSHATAVNRIDCVHSALKYWKVYRTEQTTAHSISAYKSLWKCSLCIQKKKKNISETFSSTGLACLEWQNHCFLTVRSENGYFFEKRTWGNMIKLDYADIDVSPQTSTTFPSSNFRQVNPCLDRIMDPPHAPSDPTLIIRSVNGSSSYILKWRWRCWLVHLANLVETDRNSVLLMKVVPSSFKLASMLASVACAIWHRKLNNLMNPPK